MFEFLLSRSLRPSLLTMKRFWGANVPDGDESMSVAWEEASRILISNSDDLLIQNPASYLYRNGPARHEPCLSQLLSAVYPPYRTRPLSERAINLDRFVGYQRVGYQVNDSRLFPKLLGCESWNSETISLLDTQTCWALLKWIASMLASCYDTEGWLDHLRLLVKHGIGPTLVQNVDVPDHCASPLCSYVAAATWGWPDSWHGFEQGARSACMSWLQTLADAGLELELYGRSESRLLGTGGHQYVWEGGESHPAIELSRPVLALSYGPAVSDWCLWLDCPYDQCAGDFWYMLEHDYTVSVPGEWFDEDEERAIWLRSRPGRFKSLATSRRKRRRYLRVMQMNDDDASVRLGPLWESLAYINGKLCTDDARSEAWHDWPPLAADVEHPSLDEWGLPQYPEEYCSVCDKRIPLLDYYDCRPDIAGGISAGMCHGGNHET